MTEGKADVYIIESLHEDDEREGEVISKTLRMSGKNPIYRYVRTAQELQHFVDDFEDSEYRYLHISCHGGKRGIATTLDHLTTEEFAAIVGPALDGKRLFMSTCLAATMAMAGAVFRAGGATSLAGPKNKIYFDDSVILWSAFYHLMFKTDADRMKRIHIKEKLAKVGLLVNEKINFYHRIRVDSNLPKCVELPTSTSTKSLV
ncbi:MAG: hypothetical protein JNL14_19560 [Devosia sp.]|uniref:hypothetical protein n=1 Tax=Devosia sp. TaxID=1871048 RepID=UPI001A491D1F|nr:hypothetical protein [Devosia sp.]MBL8599940.1 hypothetical protein [Devosia sp.]